MVIALPFASSPSLPSTVEMRKYGPLTNLCLFFGSLLVRLVAAGAVVGMVLRVSVVARVVPDALEQVV